MNNQPFWKPGELEQENERAMAERKKWDVYHAWHQAQLSEAASRAEAMSPEECRHFHERALQADAVFTLERHIERHADHPRGFVPDDWRSDWDESEETNEQTAIYWQHGAA